MSNFTILAERNRVFAEHEGHKALTSVIPRVPVFVITCLDPRTDPASFLGVDPGDAPIVRNAGGRVTEDVINDVAFIAHLAETLGASGLDGPPLEVAVVHHTQCGTGFLADLGFRADFAARTGLDEGALEAEAVTDPDVTVRIDVDRLITSPKLSSKVLISGHVYDLDTGLVTTVVEAARPVEQSEVAA